MTIKLECLPLGLVMLTLFTAAAQAQDPRAQELEQKLKERDQVIIELLERVEALERRVGGLSYQHTFEKRQIQPGPTVSANFGGFIALSPETSLRLLFSGAYQDETELSGSEIDGSDRTIGTFVVGGSTLLAPGTLLNLSLGIGLTDDADDFSLSLSLPIRSRKPLY